MSRQITMQSLMILVIIGTEELLTKVDGRKVDGRTDGRTAGYLNSYIYASYYKQV